MDLKKVILQEHTRSNALKIVCYVGSDKLRFEKLIAVFLTGPYRVTQRASWPIGICVENHPALVLPHLRIILKQLERPGLHPAVKRNAIRLLQLIEIPKRFHGQVTDLCFTFLQDKKEPIAIRVFSMRVRARICKDNTDLKNELRIIVEDGLAFASPAFVSRARKVMSELG